MKKRYQTHLADLYSSINPIVENVEYAMDTNLNNPPAAETNNTVEGQADIIDNSEEAHGVNGEITNKDVTVSEKKPKKIDENSLEQGNFSERNINTSTMSEKNKTNIFDRLYSTIMENDEPPFGDDENPFGGDEAGDEMEALGLDDAGDEVTISLPKDLAQELCDALKAKLGDEEHGEGGEEGDDLDLELGEDDMGGPQPSQPLGESGEATPLADGVGKMQNKNNKVGNVSGKGGSHGDGNIDGEDGDAKPLPDGVSKMQGKDQKVGSGDWGG